MPVRIIVPIRSPSPISEAGTDSSSETTVPTRIIPLENPMDTSTNGSHVFSVADLDDYSGRRFDGMNPNDPNSWRPSTSLDDEDSDDSTIYSDEFNIYDLAFTWPLDEIDWFGESGTGIPEEEPGDIRVQDQADLVQQLTEGISALSPMTGPQREMNEENQEIEAEHQQPPQQIAEEQVVGGGLKRDLTHEDDEDDDDDESPLSLTKIQKTKDEKDEDKDDSGPSKI